MFDLQSSHSELSSSPGPLQGPPPAPPFAGASANSGIDLGHNHCMRLVNRPPVIMARGSGSWLFAEDGTRYLDFVQGWAVNSLGHAPELIRRTLLEQSSALLTTSPAYFTRPALELAELLCRLSRLHSVFLCNSGAEATDAAIKLARKWAQKHRPGAYKVITTHNSFHGRTLAAVSASGKPGWETAFPPNLPGFCKVPFGDALAVKNAIDAETCAVMLEPIQGEAGVVVPPDGYLAELRAITERAGILLILDEIQTGCSRTGPFLRSQAEGVVPDILTLGKGLGGGVPVAALLASERATCFELGDHGGTYCGNPLTAACALEVVKAISTPEFSRNVLERGEQLSNGLARLRDALPGAGIVEVRGAGLLYALRLDHDGAEAIRDRCFELGLLINAARPNLVRFMPQLAVDATAIELMLEILGRALSELAAQRPLQPRQAERLEAPARG
ncbi:MAG TPA: aminotransferase class III-fold pyridoxal phosphate-dependent enzyme [Polyangiaceae bacterium]|nr:aminotransferase class III-fold pyridoxal phosphate-dependent enzyme [Polyangiaceae bacterium]